MFRNGTLFHILCLCKVTALFVLLCPIINRVEMQYDKIEIYSYEIISRYLGDNRKSCPIWLTKHKFISNS